MSELEWTGLLSWAREVIQLMHEGEANCGDVARCLAAIDAALVKSITDAAKSLDCGEGGEMTMCEEFERWAEKGWAEKAPYTGSYLECWQAAYRAGQQEMRERAAEICDRKIADCQAPRLHLSKAGEEGYRGGEIAAADISYDIRALPLDEPGKT